MAMLRSLSMSSISALRSPTKMTGSRGLRRYSVSKMSSSASGGALGVRYVPSSSHRCDPDTKVAPMELGESCRTPSKDQCLAVVRQANATPPCRGLGASVAMTVYPKPFRVWRPRQSLVLVSSAISVLRSSMARSACRSRVPRADTTL